MSYKNTRRLNKSVSPTCMDRSLGAELSTKCTAKYDTDMHNETTIQSNIHGQLLKQYNECIGGGGNFNWQRVGMGMRDDELGYWSLGEINNELNNNSNLIGFLINRRKLLSEAKRRKLREQMSDKIAKARMTDLSNFQWMEDEEFRRVINFCPNSQVAIKILGKVVRLLPELKGPRADQEEKSEGFWVRNRQLENEIDSMLEKMKAIDKNLEKENHDVNEICKNLDHIEQNLKSIVGNNKGEDNLERVEPLFKEKKRSYEVLNARITQRQRIKDIKVAYIKKIKDALGQLKLIRQNRLHQITQFFGLENVWDIQKYNFKDAGDFSSGFEELLKLREREGYLEMSERDIWQEVETLGIQQEGIYGELVRKQSDEEKAYYNYTKLMNQKIKYTSILSVFGDEESHNQILSLNPNEISKKFKQYKSFLKRFMQEDSLIKQGLIKTNETSQTFGTVLRYEVLLFRAIENQKERRQQLLALLESCIRKKGDYEQRREDVRNLVVQITKNQQEHTHHEEELQVILSDGDIESYKRIGNLISKCDSEKLRLMALKERLQHEMEVMDKQVVGMANKIQVDYEDILCQIVPADYEYSLKNSDDVKKLRNHLRKMYKRLGILHSQ